MNMGICYSALCYEDLKIMIFIFSTYLLYLTQPVQLSCGGPG